MTPPRKRIKLAVPEMAKLREAGCTDAEIARQAGVSRAWVGKLLSEEPKMPRRNRREFAAAHLTLEVKEALRFAAEQEGVSMSTLIATAIREKLDAMGVPILLPTNNDPHLPFEGEK